ncbi:MAG: hypothetical protein KGH49_01175 [Candidatus Micrarchaeota archaeon]|nr:hypothetical protein [Candidatus Micrarchaeota archaeon]
MERRQKNPLHFYSNNGQKSIKVEEMLVLSGLDFKKVLVENKRSIHIPAIVTDTERINCLKDIKRYLEQNSVTEKVSLD